MHDSKLPADLSELESLPELPEEFIRELILSPEDARKRDYTYPKKRLLRRIRRGRPWRRSNTTKGVRAPRKSIELFNRFLAAALAGTGGFLFFIWLTGFLHPVYFPQLVGLWSLIAALWTLARFQKKIRGEVLSSLLAFLVPQEELENPVDWVWFWERHLRELLREKKTLTLRYLEEIVQTRKVLEGVMRSDPQSADDPTILLKWQEAGSGQARAAKLFRALGRIEEDLKTRVKEIRKLRAKERQLHEEYNSQRNKSRKVMRLKRSTQSILDRWEEEELKLSRDLSILEGAFQDRLLWARDYLEALEQTKEEN